MLARPTELRTALLPSPPVRACSYINGQLVRTVKHATELPSELNAIIIQARRGLKLKSLSQLKSPNTRVDFTCNCSPA